MCFSYLDENDDLQYAPNSFYNINIYNEFVKSIYEDDKAKHFTKILVENGFVCKEDASEIYC
jgi:hypothetical protein